MCTVDPRLSGHQAIRITDKWSNMFSMGGEVSSMHTTNAMNIINLVVRIIEGSNKWGSDNRGSTVIAIKYYVPAEYVKGHAAICKKDTLTLNTLP